MLVDDGLLQRGRGRLGRRAGTCRASRSRRRSTPCSPRGSIGWTPEERAVIERASVIGRVVLVGSGRGAVAGGAAAARSAPPAVARAQGADPARPLGSQARTRSGSPTSSIRDAAYQGIPKARASRAARAVRRVDRGQAARPRRGVRGDRRLPPRAGAPCRCSSSVRRTSASSAGPARGGDARLGRPAGVRPRRHARRRQPALARGLAAARASDPRAARALLRARLRAARDRRLRAARRRRCRDRRRRRPRPRATPACRPTPPSSAVDAALDRARGVGGRGRSAEAKRAIAAFRASRRRARPGARAGRCSASCTA